MADTDTEKSPAPQEDKDSAAPAAGPSSAVAEPEASDELNEAPSSDDFNDDVIDATGGDSAKSGGTGAGKDGQKGDSPAQSGSAGAANPPADPGNASGSSGSGGKRFNLLKHRPNIYVMLFVLVILVAGTATLIGYRQSRRTATDQIKTQGIDQKTLEQLANSDANVGDNHTVLNVRSSAVFAGQVLVRQNLSVGGNVQVGGTTALKELTVSGTSQFGQATVNNDLSVAGNTALQGTVTIAKSLQVGGGGTFSGPVSAPQVATSSLQLNGDLTLTHHIHAGGGQPGRSGGPALGRGGSASVSGSDTAGSVAINTGSGAAAGCFITVNFTSHYNSTPHVLVTPVGAAAGSLDYYVNRTTTSFSICDASAPPAGRSFGFDYFVLD